MESFDHIRPYLNWYKYIRLNQQQFEALRFAIDAQAGVRPTPAEYQRIAKSLKKIPAPKATTKIPGTVVGINYEPGWPDPCVTVTGDVKLPEGLALSRLGTSSGTKSVENAATATWRALWNGWDLLGKEGRNALLKQANKQT